MHGASHIINIIVIIHLKCFAVSDWLKLSPRLILHKQSALTKFGTAIYNRFDDTFAWKRGCLNQPRFQALPPFRLLTSELKKMAFTAIQRQNS